MSALANMIAKQKAAQEEKNHGTTAHSTDVVPGGNGIGVGTDSSDGSGGDSKPAARLTFGVKKATGGSAEPSKALVPSSESVSQVASGAIVSLDELGDSEETGVVRGATSNGMAFDDEIPCTAPERDLPEGLNESQLAFVEQLDGIYQIVHDPELFGSMVRTIMTELQECPDYMSLMADQDVHTMIRGLRSSMGLAKIKKAEKSTKARGSRKAPATTAMITTADELFNSEDW